MAVTWITADDVVAELGSGSATDPAIVKATAVANVWARKRRTQYGYTEDVDTSAPDEAVAHGTVLVAAALVQARGQTGGLVPEFSELAGAPTPAFANWGEVNRLLGIPRPGFG